MIPLRDFFAAYVEWSGVKKTLEGSERLKFERWLARVHPKLVQSCAHEPALLRQMCREVKGGGAMLQAKGIGMATLVKYAPVLSRRYRALSERSCRNFQEFLERVLREYPTRAAFLRYIAEEP